MTESILKIDGMMCGMCENHVCDTIRNQFPVKKVSASHTKGIATIISPEPLDEEALRKAIAEKCGVQALRKARSLPPLKSLKTRNGLP